MRSRRKSAPPSSRGQRGTTGLLRSVLESHNRLLSAGASTAKIQEWLAESAQQLVNATASGCLVRGVHDFCVDSVASTKEGSDALALLTHARAFVAQAVEQDCTL